jgi:O-antigen/teichoic acid export membrane protein
VHKSIARIAAAQRRSLRPSEFFSPSGRLRAALAAGVPHLMAATVATSGLAYLQQLVIARFVSPADFGIVRSVEAALAVLLVLASFGAPTLAVRLAAEVEESQQGALLRRLLLLAVCSSALVCLAMVAWSLIGPRTPVTRVLGVLVWVVILTSASRIIYNFHQGIMRVHRASVVATGLAAVSFALLTVLVARHGLNGWIVGRLVGEALSCAGLLWLVWRLLRESRSLGQTYYPSWLLRFGAVITVSFLLRGALDATGIFMLGVTGAQPAQVGYFGLGTLLMTAILLLPGSLGGVLLPRMVVRRTDAEPAPYLASGIRWAIGLTLPASFLGTLLAPILLAALLPAYTAAGSIVRVLLWVAPCRAVTAVAGTQLLAASNVRTTILINGAGVLGLVGLAVMLGPSYGAYGVAWSTLFVELCLAITTVLFAVRQSRPSGQVGNPTQP